MDGAYSSARDRLGQTLAGKYVLDDVIGIGGTAVVYRATHRNGHRVAVKILHDYLNKSAEVCTRFMREGYLANKLDHPGTVRVLDDDTTDDGAAFLVLELLEGETLEERRERAGGQLELDAVIGWMDQLLAVLEVAHAAGVVHRDIKPSNLFVTTDGTLKVLDFGIARIVDENAATVTKTGQMMGTPAFMPPEQALSKPREIDAQSDLWAVGATMFTLLSGELVHSAESTSEHLVKAATAQARSLARVLPGVPENIEAFVARALSFYKSGRFLSATEMRQELWRVRLDPGRPIGTPSKPPPRRNPLSDAPTIVGRRDSGGLSEANMSVSGESLALAPPPNRTLAVALAAALALALAAAGALALGLFGRPAPEARSAAALAPPAPAETVAAPTAIRESAPPPPAVSVEDLPRVGTTAAGPSATAKPAKPPATAPRPSVTATTPPKASAATGPAPATAPASTADIYRPF